MQEKEKTKIGPSQAKRGLKLGAWVGILITTAVVGACGGKAAPTPTPPLPDGGGQQASVELFTYGFNPKSFSYIVGNTVQFALTSKDIDHTFTVRELGIDWSVPKPNKTQLQSYTFTRPGVFKLVCTVPGHEVLGMVGTVAVE